MCPLRDETFMSLTKLQSKYSYQTRNKLQIHGGVATPEFERGDSGPDPNLLGEPPCSSLRLDCHHIIDSSS
jgi:hypothetical protein